MTQDYTKKTYLERSKSIQNPVAKRLLELMEAKKSNLSVAADVTTKKALLHLADTLGPYICVLKTHIDILEDFDSDLVEQLSALADKHRFLIFEGVCVCVTDPFSKLHFKNCIPRKMAQKVCHRSKVCGYWEYSQESVWVWDLQDCIL